MKHVQAILIVVAVLLAAGCQSTEAAKPAGGTAQGQQGATKAAAPTGEPTKAAPSAKVDALPRSGLPGKVAEVHHAGGYTYLRVSTASGDIWAAVTEVKTKIGDTVVIPAGTVMTNFHSKSLNMTFDRIFFVESVQGAEPVKKPTMPASGPASAAASAPAKGPASAPASSPADPKGQAHGDNPNRPVSPGATASNPRIDIGGIAKAEGGQQVAEVFAQKDALGGKTVKIRGRVVKFNAQILGKNWIHIQDGSGQAASGNHDLTVTTADTPKVGDLVVIEGKLSLNRDFGAGYKYGVIVEDAKVTPSK